MGRVTKGAAAAAAVVTAGAIAMHRALSRPGRGNWPGRGSTGRWASRWQTVTVDRPPAQVAPKGQLPEPLVRLGDGVETRVRPAPGGRGTELAVRLRAGGSDVLTGMVAHLTGDDPRMALRTALRQAKQLAETGELLSPDRPSTTRRTLLNRPLEVATRHGRDQGRV
ncbi:hypothetical protein [Micromonospora polyrhachis]|uniref:Uncharacterized protein n=1 Tax=Micromonospora polyrhachis TaxID=1282883 RepID=A0A7W7SUI9_9ACTN|nr:hypothetical protein [Micromonospora polyrhachis]MBB4960821.1 hypothetical protein [Micromonospora polyrhachis]